MSPLEDIEVCVCAFVCTGLTSPQPSVSGISIGS